MDKASSGGKEQRLNEVQKAITHGLNEKFMLRLQCGLMSEKLRQRQLRGKRAEQLNRSAESIDAGERKKNLH